MAQVSHRHPFFCPCPPPANAVLCSRWPSLMCGGGEIDIDQGEVVSERESMDSWAGGGLWMMPLMGPGH